MVHPFDDARSPGQPPHRFRVFEVLEEALLGAGVVHVRRVDAEHDHLGTEFRENKMLGPDVHDPRDPSGKRGVVDERVAGKLGPELDRIEAEMHRRGSDHHDGYRALRRKRLDLVGFRLRLPVVPIERLDETTVHGAHRDLSAEEKDAEDGSDDQHARHRGAAQGRHGVIARFPPGDPCRHARQDGGPSFRLPCFGAERATESLPRPTGLVYARVAHNDRGGCLAEGFWHARIRDAPGPTNERRARKSRRRAGGACRAAASHRSRGRSARPAGPALLVRDARRAVGGDGGESEEHLFLFVPDLSRLGLEQ